MLLQKGIDISKAAASLWTWKCRSPSARYSTLQDLDAGRHTEVDMFSGRVGPHGAGTWDSYAV
ncbi:MAG: ketopantoate reductase C-terminal domain-containing protein [Blautia faecis]